MHIVCEKYDQIRSTPLEVGNGCEEEGSQESGEENHNKEESKEEVTSPNHVVAENGSHAAAVSVFSSYRL